MNWRHLLLDFQDFLCILQLTNTLLTFFNFAITSIRRDATRFPRNCFLIVWYFKYLLGFQNFSVILYLSNILLRFFHFANVFFFARKCLEAGMKPALVDKQVRLEKVFFFFQCFGSVIFFNGPDPTKKQKRIRILEVNGKEDFFSRVFFTLWMILRNVKKFRFF